MSDKKNNYSQNIIVLISVTSLIEILYACVYAKTSNYNYILISETLAFLVLQVVLFFIVKAAKVLLSERNFKLYLGTSGLAHSVFMAFLVSQRISTNIEKTLFVLGLFIVLHLSLILLWLILYKRSKKHTTTKIYGSKQRKLIAVFSLAGAFIGVVLARVLDYDIIIFDIFVSLLSLTYTVFVLCFIKGKTNQPKIEDGFMS